MLHGVEWLGRQYSALSKGASANSTLVQTITTLAARLQTGKSSGSGQGGDGQGDGAPSDPAQERRGAILTLKGLAKDHPKEVAAHAGKELLDFLVHASKDDANDDVLRALIETLLTICTPAEPTAASQASSRIGLGKKQPATPAIPLALDQFLETSPPLHALLPLLAPNRSFYLRFSSLQLLALVLRHRKTSVQSHVLTSPGGCGAILECLSTTSPTGHSLGSSAEIIRNEALLLLPHLVDSNADIQKLIAFEGAFEKLLDVVAQEGRIEGGVVVQDALEALEALLRYNVSNQNYFRETLSIPMLAPLLFYPPPLPANAPAHIASQRDEQLEGFAFQPWEYDASDEFSGGQTGGQHGDGQSATPTTGGSADNAAEPSARFVGDTQKLINARLVVGIAGLLVQGVGEGKRANQNALLSTGFFHALLDLALGSSAPVPLRTQALQVLASLLQHSRNVQDALGEASVTPVEPIKTQLAADLAGSDVSPQRPSMEGGASAGAVAAPSAPVEYARLPPQSALLVLIQAALNGVPTPHRPIDGGYPSITGFRAAAVKALQSILSDNIDARLFVVASMASAEQSRPEDQPGAVLLDALTVLPSNGQVEGFDEFKALFAGMILNSAIKGSDTVKDLALRLRYGADGKVKVLPENDDQKQSSSEDDDDDASILSVLIGNITVALRSQGDAVKTERSQAAGAVLKGPTPTSWTRILIAHLTLLALWLHKSPKSVAHVVADSSNVQAIVQLVAEGANGEPLLVGLGTWVLGILYEWGPPATGANEGGDGNNKSTAASESDGAMTRREIHNLATSRIGLDQYEAKLERLRDDPRLRLVGPDVLDKVGLQPDPVTAAAAASAASKQQQHQPPSTQAGMDSKDASSADDSSVEIWFDWTWTEFWRNESVTIANALLVPPGTTSAAAASAPAELLDAQRQIEQLRDEVKRLHRDVEARERSLAEATQQNASHEQALAELQTSVADAGRHTETAESQLHASQERVLQVERSLEEEKQRFAEVQEQLAGTEEQVRVLKEQLQQQQQQQGGGVRDAGGESQQHGSASNDEELASLRATLAASEEEQKRLHNAISEWQDKLTASDEEKTRLQAAIDQVREEEANKAQEAIAEEQRKVKEALDKVSELEKLQQQQQQEKSGKQKDDAGAAAAARKKAEADLKAAQQKHGEALKAAESKHSEALKAAEKKHSDELKAAEKKHTDAAKAADKKHADTLKKQTDAAVKAAEKKHADAATASEKKQADAVRDAEAAVKKKADEEIASLKKQLEEAKKSSSSKDAGEGGDSTARVAELEQENQDLLVMLDELSTKRKRDKAKLKEKGEEVSEEEEEDDDDDEDVD